MPDRSGPTARDTKTHRHPAPLPHLRAVLLPELRPQAARVGVHNHHAVVAKLVRLARFLRDKWLWERVQLNDENGSSFPPSQTSAHREAEHAAHRNSNNSSLCAKQASQHTMPLGPFLLLLLLLPLHPKEGFTTRAHLDVHAYHQPAALGRPQ